jgi:hypothetical protein
MHHQQRMNNNKTNDKDTQNKKNIENEKKE